MAHNGKNEERTAESTSLTFQLIDIDYVIVGEEVEKEPVLRLFGKDALGQSVCALVTGFEPYMYVEPAKDVSIKELENMLNGLSDIVKRVEKVALYRPLGYQKKKVDMVAVYTRIPSDIPHLKEMFKKDPEIAKKINNI